MDANWKRIIAHVDMDAFFASVEQLVHPEWRGKPVIVGADPKKGKGRGVVSAASYEARKYGVHSALPIAQAYKRCPNGIYVYPNGKLYSDYSKKIFGILHSFTPVVEPLSIDEAFLDFTGALHLYGTAEDLGKSIKRAIKEQTGLTASVGIAPTKSVAKIASDYDKPDGLTIVPPDGVQEFLDPLPVSRLWGVGKRMLEALQGMGIHTVSQLRKYPPDLIHQKFGKMGAHILNMATGRDERSVQPEHEVKSVSNERTFGRDEENPDVVLQTVFALAEKVGGRMRRAGIKGQTVHLKIRFSDFSTFTRSHTLGYATYLTPQIFEAVRDLLQEFLPLPAPVRLLGVGMSNLVPEAGSQLSLWDLQNEKVEKAEKLMDAIQDRFGKNVIRHAESINISRKIKDK
ncbi:MAG: DNA polymerase IV [Calditrichia bacterium]